MGMVERELTRLFVDHGTTEGIVENKNVVRLKGEQIAMEPGVNASAGGKQIARAIYEVIEK